MANLKKIASGCLFLLSAFSVFSQSKLVHAKEVIGKVQSYESLNIFKKINAVKNLDRTKIASLKKCLDDQLKVVYSNPILNPPKGFDVKPSFEILKDPFSKVISFPACSFSFGFYYLDKDVQTGKVKTSMDGTLIEISTNDIDHFFRQVGNFWKDCSDAKFPLFFEQPPISDSNAVYIELNFKNYKYPAIAPNKPYRIVKRNDRPLFVPLTRKEFVKFLVAQKKYQIKDDEKTIQSLQKSLKESQKTLQNPPSYMTAEVLKALSDGVVTTQTQIDYQKEEIKNKQKKIQEYENIINGMTTQEATSPTRLDYNKKNTDFDQIEILVPVGKMEGVGLYKFNPGYYDRSAGAPGVQLIFVNYQLPNLSTFGKTHFNYLEQNTIDIFNQLDYHRLKESMK